MDCSFRFPIPAEFASSLKAVKLLGISWVLVPRDAVLEDASIGANGGAFLSMKNASVRISAYNPALTALSVLSNGSVFFDNARKRYREAYPDEAKEMTIPKGLQSVRKDKTTVFYSLPKEGNLTTHGVAKFHDKQEESGYVSFHLLGVRNGIAKFRDRIGTGDMNFHKLEVTTDASHTKLASTILNFYYSQNRSHQFHSDFE